MGKQARRSHGFRDLEPYDCQYPWPERCFVQCGDEGMVFVRGGENYTTAFFEAFPRDPNTFIRGEGPSIAAAEDKAWQKYQRYLSCPRHEFERRDRTDGAATCKHCGLFVLDHFPPLTTCHYCGQPTDWSTDKEENYFCEECEEKGLVPPETFTELYLQAIHYREGRPKWKKESDDLYAIAEDPRAVFTVTRSHTFPEKPWFWRVTTLDLETGEFKIVDQGYAPTVEQAKDSLMSYIIQCYPNHRDFEEEDLKNALLDLAGGDDAPNANKPE